MPSTYGSTFTDLQQGRLLEKDRQDRASADYQKYLSELSGQRSSERVATKDLENQDKQYYAGLEANERISGREAGLRGTQLMQQDRQYYAGLGMDRDELALKKYIAETGSAQQLRDYELRKSIASDSNNIAKRQADANILNSIGNMSAAFRSQLTSGNVSTALSTYGAQIREINKRLADIVSREGELKNTTEALNERLRAQNIQGQDASWIPFYGGSQEARAAKQDKEIKEGTAKPNFGDYDNAYDWAESLVPGVAKELKWNPMLMKFEPRASNERTFAEQQLAETKAVLDEFKNKNPSTAADADGILAELDTLSKKFGIDIGLQKEYTPSGADTKPSAVDAAPNGQYTPPSGGKRTKDPLGLLE